MAHDILTENSGFSIHLHTHCLSPVIHRLELLSETRTSFLYSNGNHESALEKSIHLISKPDVRFSINSNDQIIASSQHLAIGRSKQISQSIANIAQLTTDTNCWFSFDYYELQNAINRPGFGVSVFGQSSLSAEIAAKNAVYSMRSITRNERRQPHFLMPITRSSNITVNTLNAVHQMLSSQSLDYQEIFLAGAIEDRNMGNNIEINLVAIWFDKNHPEPRVDNFSV